MEGDFQPPPDAAQNTPPVDPIRALIERKKLTLPTPQKAYDMLMDLMFEAHHDPTIPEPIEETIRNVSLAFGFLVYDKLRPTKQALFLARLNAEREEFHTEQLELTPEEATMLEQVARSVNFPYDPGSETTPEQRTFPFSRVERHPPEDLSLYTMVTGREKPPEHDPLIVDSDSPSTPIEG